MLPEVQPCWLELKDQRWWPLAGWQQAATVVFFFKVAVISPRLLS
jgi:hypothetical protein